MGLFQEIKSVHGQKTAVFSLLNGEKVAEKMLVADGEIRWCSEKGFLVEHLSDLVDLDETGIREMDGRTIFCDFISGQKKLVICGAGHVSMAIIALGKMLGFHVIVLEDRPSFADNARRAQADEVICENFTEGLAQVKSDTDTYFVVVTRGHRFDETCLEEILKKKYAYVGMMGSRARSAIVKRNLKDAGFPEAQVEGIHTPIGLNIHAETPEEIAVSILGEIIELKNRKKRSFGYPEEVLEVLLGLEADGGSAVLATILERHGSAPREVGTKMIVCPDGRMIGTIGGGCMEARVREAALRMLRSGQADSRICNVNMTAADAEEEGMVCGGNIDVLLEVVVFLSKNGIKMA